MFCVNGVSDIFLVPIDVENIIFLKKMRQIKDNLHFNYMADLSWQGV